MMDDLEKLRCSSGILCNDCDGVSPNNPRYATAKRPSSPESRDPVAICVTVDFEASLRKKSAPSEVHSPQTQIADRNPFPNAVHSRCAVFALQHQSRRKFLQDKAAGPDWLPKIPRRRATIAL